MRPAPPPKLAGGARTSSFGGNYMDVKLMTVATSTYKRQAKILITGSWLDRFGFSPEIIVTVFYQNGQLLMHACGIGLDIYKQVVGEVRRQRGQIIQIFNWTRAKTAAHLVLEGAWLERQGFMIGDPIIACFEPGLIRIKHLPLDDIGFSVQTDATYRITKVQTNGSAPMILLNGRWLHDYGFVAGQGAALSYERDCLRIQPCQKRIVRSAYGTVPARINILSRKQIPALQMAGQWISDIGYQPGDFLIIQCLDGQLLLRRLEDRHFYL